MSTDISFPAPVGGVPFERDFGPSVLFATLYAILVIAGIYRFARTTTRTLVRLGTFAFAVERIVIWSLRAKQAKTPAEDLDRNLTIYWQMTFAIGYISLHADTITLLRCLFVRTTRGISPKDQTPLESDRESPEPAGPYGGYAMPVDEDQPDTRFWYRRAFGALALLTWVPIIIGIVMGYNYVQAETNAEKAQNVQTLRYAVSAIVFVFLLVLQAFSLFGLLYVRRIQRTGVLLGFVISTVLIIIPLYHFVVMHNWTTSLTSMALGSQNTAGEKAAFYIFQALPEVAAAALLMVPNIRELFSTGMWGDRSTDSSRDENKA
ncbi:uncharacterized protein PHACADRAFT_258120 [Phanerochaete carnosa HHB-10118-sp]|uniref:Uncharacterized protein n=1 Tax=Phanerochaete carnosa (strain HHB-10118-sp) TaxID=650164 RepID=K5W5W4_PHACS|nr:uncharacterized protein PHACADRAFT_258120 [Phanerochaete carnosa HHB-10118-sp]EKM54334.1 hypothetical protein PHACADRAFT_258120 [Phanerochaete carnosa HHB-10118-sp]